MLDDGQDDDLPNIAERRTSNSVANSTYFHFNDDVFVFHSSLKCVGIVSFATVLKRTNCCIEMYNCMYVALCDSVHFVHRT